MPERGFCGTIMLHISINMFFSCRFFTRNRPVYGAKTAKQRGKNKKSICARVLCYEKKYKQKQIVRSPSHGVFRVRVWDRPNSYDEKTMSRQALKKMVLFKISQEFAEAAEQIA